MSLFAARGEGMPLGMPSRHGDGEMWRWLMTFVAPHWRRFALVLSLSLLVAVGGLAQPYMLLSWSLIKEAMAQVRGLSA